MRHLYSAVALGLLAATAARADVTVFDNEAAFLAAAPIVATETFDDLPDMQVPGRLEVDGLVFVTRGIWQMPGFCSLDRPLGANNIALRHVIFQAAGGGRGAVNAVGFLVTTFAIAPPANYVIVVTTADGAVTREPLPGVTSPAPAYRGFLSTSPITSVSMQAVGVTQFNFCFDDVSRSAITPTVDSGAPDANDPLAFE